MEVALALSSQKPGESESCLSLAIFASLFATSKKSLQNRYAVSQSLYLFYCHAANIMQKCFAGAQQSGCHQF
jgi:hypothetical protein